jgi:hypothetical protein
LVDALDPICIQQFYQNKNDDLGQNFTKIQLFKRFAFIPHDMAENGQQ